MSRKIISFYRFDSSGNTFLITSYFPTSGKQRKQLAKWVCDSYQGFKTDGCIFLKKNGKASLSWDFYNSDGSSAEMCGNAVRAVALFCESFLDCSIQKQPTYLQTSYGPVRLRKQQSNQPLLKRARSKKAGTKKKAGSILYAGEWSLNPIPPRILDLTNRTRLKPAIAYIDTGVPHFVVRGSPDLNLARILRRPTKEFPRGANVTFVSAGFPNLKAVTFERGVEDFTKACGTGAIAAAICGYYWKKGLFQKTKKKDLNTSEVLNKEFSCKVQMPGGKLAVELTSDARVCLIGPVKFDFELRQVI